MFSIHGSEIRSVPHLPKLIVIVDLRCRVHFTLIYRRRSCRIAIAASFFFVSLVTFFRTTRTPFPIACIFRTSRNSTHFLFINPFTPIICFRIRSKTHAAHGVPSSDVHAQSAKSNKNYESQENGRYVCAT